MAPRRKESKSEAPPEPIRVASEDGRPALHLEGVVGVAQARRLRELAMDLAETGQPVNVRCEHLQHLDCAAVQVLLALHETLKSRGAAVTLANLPDSVQRTLRTTGIASAF